MKVKNGSENDYSEYKRINATDSYSNRCVTYGEEWADLMESEMAKGKSIAEIASDTSHQADTDGITGFMYGAAVAGLSKFWEHGEELRLWHNRDISPRQADKVNATPGAVLNPAILVIGGAEET